MLLEGDNPMDKNGNLDENDKVKLCEFLLTLHKWWHSPSVGLSDTRMLLEKGEAFRKSLEKED